MNYEDLTDYISTPHRYADVTTGELYSLTVDHFFTVLGGIVYVGTYTPVDSLADRELFQTQQPEAASEEAGATKSVSAVESSLPDALAMPKA